MGGKMTTDRLTRAVNGLFENDPQPFDGGSIGSMADFLDMTSDTDISKCYQEITTPEQREQDAEMMGAFIVPKNGD